MRSFAALALFVSCLCVIAAPGRAVAGAWTQDPGRGYAKLSLRWLPGLHYSDGSGGHVPIGTYHELTVDLYAELGLARYVTLTIQMPVLQLVALRNPLAGRVESHLQTGDPTFGLVLQLARVGRFALSFESGFLAPLVRSTKAINEYSTADGNPLIGTLNFGAHVYDVHWGFAFGYGWDTMYTAAMARYVYRSGGFDHEIRWSAEYGVRFGRWALRARVSGKHPLGNGSAPKHASLNGIGNGTAYVGASGEGEFALSDHWTLGLNVQGSLGYAIRQTRGPVISLYLATTF